MFRSYIIIALIFTVAGARADDGAALYRSLERHLQSLKSLEIHYRAEGATPEGAVTGRMIFQKPDKFFHDTPEWTLCEVGTEQWRYLKQQTTLILEKAEAREWLPETLLLNLGRNLEPAMLLSAENGVRTLKLTSSDPSAPAEVDLRFAAGQSVPSSIHYTLEDGSSVHYELEQWMENAPPPATLFEAPDVPAEQRIDFRAAKP